MRVAVFALAIFVVASPSRASTSCMSLSEARKQFPSLHLYWHGANHCWDATSGSHVAVHRTLKASRIREAEPKADWRDAMSEMLPADAAPSAQVSPLPGADAFDRAAPDTNWRDRWVDIAPVLPPGILGRKVAVLAAAAAPSPPAPPAAHKVVPMITATGVILAFVGLVLMLTVIELLFRNTIDERRR